MLEQPSDRMKTAGIMIDEHGVLCCDAVNNSELPRRWVVPASLRERLCTLKHFAKASGHPGATRLAQNLSRYWYWQSLGKDCFAIVRRCPACVEINQAQAQKIHSTDDLSPGQALGVHCGRYPGSPADHDEGQPFRLVHYGHILENVYRCCDAGPDRVDSRARACGSVDRRLRNTGDDTFRQRLRICIQVLRRPDTCTRRQTCFYLSLASCHKRPGRKMERHARGRFGTHRDGEGLGTELGTRLHGL
jgi:hypothetical protein